MFGLEKPNRPEESVKKATDTLHSFDNKAVELKKSKDDPEVTQDEPISEKEMTKILQDAGKGNFKEADVKGKDDVIEQSHKLIKSRPLSKNKIMHRDPAPNIIGKDGYALSKTGL